LKNKFEKPKEVEKSEDSTNNSPFLSDDNR